MNISKLLYFTWPWLAKNQNIVENHLKTTNGDIFDFGSIDSNTYTNNNEIGSA